MSNYTAKTPPLSAWGKCGSQAPGRIIVSVPRAQALPCAEPFVPLQLVLRELLDGQKFAGRVVLQMDDAGQCQDIIIHRCRVVSKCKHSLDTSARRDDCVALPCYGARAPEGDLFRFKFSMRLASATSANARFRSPRRRKTMPRLM
jgi:hypothetical protein